MVHLDTKFLFFSETMTVTTLSSDIKPFLEGVNPLHHRVKPNFFDYLRIALLALTLFPIRFASAFLCFLLSYLVGVAIL